MSGCLDGVECHRPEWCELGEKRKRCGVGHIWNISEYRHGGRGGMGRDG